MRHKIVLSYEHALSVPLMTSKISMKISTVDFIFVNKILVI